MFSRGLSESFSSQYLQESGALCGVTVFIPMWETQVKLVLLISRPRPSVCEDFLLPSCVALGCPPRPARTKARPADWAGGPGGLILALTE